jgi:hypothetical protein
MQGTHCEIETQIFTVKLTFLIITSKFLSWRPYCYSLLLLLIIIWHYCTALYCTVLYCTVLYCTVLHCTVLYCTVLYCTVLYCTVLQHSDHIRTTLVICCYCTYCSHSAPLMVHSATHSTLVYTHCDTHHYHIQKDKVEESHDMLLRYPNKISDIHLFTTLRRSTAHSSMKHST